MAESSGIYRCCGHFSITPGPIAVNSSTFAGFKVAGIPGAIAGTLGVTLVSYILIVTAASKLENMKDSSAIQWIFSGLRPAVIGLIASAAYSIAKSAVVDLKGAGIAIFAFVAIIKMKWHPLIVIGLSGHWDCCFTDLGHTRCIGNTTRNTTRNTN